jgi:hypothetical protein
MSGEETGGQLPQPDSSASDENLPRAAPRSAQDPDLLVIAEREHRYESGHRGFD